MVVVELSRAHLLVLLILEKVAHLPEVPILGFDIVHRPKSLDQEHASINLQMSSCLARQVPPCHPSKLVSRQVEID